MALKLFDSLDCDLPLNDTTALTLEKIKVSVCRKEENIQLIHDADK